MSYLANVGVIVNLFSDWIKNRKTNALNIFKSSFESYHNNADVTICQSVTATT